MLLCISCHTATVSRKYHDKISLTIEKSSTWEGKHKLPRNACYGLHLLPDQNKYYRHIKNVHSICNINDAGRCLPFCIYYGSVFCNEHVIYRAQKC